jgi:tetratricopeptide (TPR) repeat protein
VLGPDWEKEHQDNFWTATETRPLMRAMADLANALRWEDELDEAADIYRQLMKMHPTDSQGIRYELASCLLESHQFDELDKLLDRFKDDFGAAYLYTKALYLFSQNGASAEANKALRDAFKQNRHVALYLPGIMETPNDKPAGFAAGTEEEAIAYAWDNGFLWLDMPGASKWLADLMQDDPLFATVERALLKDVLSELCSEAE